MKTLVIHPYDLTTTFLCEIYKDKDWTIMFDGFSKKKLKENIRNHDRIIMLGHGDEFGLYNPDTLHHIIDSTWLWLLREKDCVCIWCNADKFVEKYGLKGLYTGMIISEPDEAYYFSINFKLDDIKQSNKLFAQAIKENIETNDVDNIKKLYNDDTNAIIEFNQQNIYKI